MADLFPAGVKYPPRLAAGMRWSILLAPALMAAFLLPPAAQPAVCTSASGCEFWDNNYHMYMLNDWDVPELDVIIVPSVSVNAMSDTATIEKAVDDWENAIQNNGASWLTSVFEINRYTVGFDTIPQEALADPEIFIFTAEYNPFVLFGIGFETPVHACLDGTMNLLPGHPHDGSSPLQTSQARCDDLGQTCSVVNTNFLLGGKRRLYDLVTHEFGHCLGIGHVGDALDFDAKTAPIHLNGAADESDIMSYQHNPAKVHCVSSLNIVGINGAFARTLGRPSSEWLVGNQYVHMTPGPAYSYVPCTNP